MEHSARVRFDPAEVIDALPGNKFKLIFPKEAPGADPDLYNKLLLKATNIFKTSTGTMYRQRKKDDETEDKPKKKLRKKKKKHAAAKDTSDQVEVKGEIIEDACSKTLEDVEEIANQIIEDDKDVKVTEEDMNTASVKKLLYSAGQMKAGPRKLGGSFRHNSIRFQHPGKRLSQLSRPSMRQQKGSNLIQSPTIRKDVPSSENVLEADFNFMKEAKQTQ